MCGRGGAPLLLGRQARDHSVAADEHALAVLPVVVRVVCPLIVPVVAVPLRAPHRGRLLVHILVHEGCQPHSREASRFQLREERLHHLSGLGLRRQVGREPVARLLPAAATRAHTDAPRRNHHPACACSRCFSVRGPRGVAWASEPAHQPAASIEQRVGGQENDRWDQMCAGGGGASLLHPTFRVCAISDRRWLITVCSMSAVALAGANRCVGFLRIATGHAEHETDRDTRRHTLSASCRANVWESTDHSQHRGDTEVGAPNQMQAQAHAHAGDAGGSGTQTSEMDPEPRANTPCAYQPLPCGDAAKLSGLASMSRPSGKPCPGRSMVV